MLPPFIASLSLLYPTHLWQNSKSEKLPVHPFLCSLKKHRNHALYHWFDGWAYCMITKYSDSYTTLGEIFPEFFSDLYPSLLKKIFRQNKVEQILLCSEPTPQYFTDMMRWQIIHFLQVQMLTRNYSVWLLPLYKLGVKLVQSPVNHWQGK